MGKGYDWTHSIIVWVVMISFIFIVSLKTFVHCRLNLHILDNLSLRTKFNSYLWSQPKLKWRAICHIIFRKPLNFHFLKPKLVFVFWYLVCAITCNYQNNNALYSAIQKKSLTEVDWVCPHPLSKITQRAGQEKITRPDLTCWNFAHDMV